MQVDAIFIPTLPLPSVSPVIRALSAEPSNFNAELASSISGSAPEQHQGQSTLAGPTTLADDLESNLTDHFASNFASNFSNNIKFAAKAPPTYDANPPASLKALNQVLLFTGKTSSKSEAKLDAGLEGEAVSKKEARFPAEFAATPAEQPGILSPTTAAESPAATDAATFSVLNALLTPVPASSLDGQDAVALPMALPIATSLSAGNDSLSREASLSTSTSTSSSAKDQIFEAFDILASPTHSSGTQTGEASAKSPNVSPEPATLPTADSASPANFSPVAVQAADVANSPTSTVSSLAATARAVTEAGRFSFAINQPANPQSQIAPPEPLTLVQSAPVAPPASAPLPVVAGNFDALNQVGSSPQLAMNSSSHTMSGGEHNSQFGSGDSGFAIDTTVQPVAVAITAGPSTAAIPNPQGTWLSVSNNSSDRIASETVGNSSLSTSSPPAAMVTSAIPFATSITDLPPVTTGSVPRRVVAAASEKPQAASPVTGNPGDGPTIPAAFDPATRQPSSPRSTSIARPSATTGPVSNVNNDPVGTKVVYVHSNNVPSFTAAIVTAGITTSNVASDCDSHVPPFASMAVSPGGSPSAVANDLRSDAKTGVSTVVPTTMSQSAPTEKKSSAALPADATSLPSSAGPNPATSLSANSLPVPSSSAAPAKDALPAPGAPLPSISAPQDPVTSEAATALPQSHQMLDSAPPVPVASVPTADVHVDLQPNAQMHFGLRTDAFGAVEIHTVVQQSQVGVTVHSERDIARWFSSEVPGLESGLNNSHLNLTAVNFDHGRSGLQTATGFQQGQSRQHFSQTPNPPSAAVSADAPEESGTEPAADLLISDPPVGTEPSRMSVSILA